eukprot:scaffold40250_cov31-Tisochrysis_lutea.AAC.1
MTKHVSAECSGHHATRGVPQRWSECVHSCTAAASCHCAVCGGTDGRQSSSYALADIAVCTATLAVRSKFHSQIEWPRTRRSK